METEEDNQAPLAVDLEEEVFFVQMEHSYIIIAIP